MKATFIKYQLQFKQDSVTSRGVLSYKDTWFLKIQDFNQVGIGECGMFRGLSYDDRPEFEDKLDWVCKNIKLGLEVLLEELSEFPAIQFGLETAFLESKKAVSRPN